MRRVEIDWLDAAGPENTEWTELDKIRDDLQVIHSCGYLVRETERSVVLVLNHYHYQEDGQTKRWAAAEIRIHRHSIVKWVDLVEAPASKSAGGRLARPSRKAGRSSTTR